MRTLNLGILAHVDAGKTTLSERLLYTAGAIDHVGSVDAGTTQTDSLELERERGITIRSAVASFLIDDLAVNLVDTPGHPDFIAEVERVLGVLDGAVLVVSAVEGVQPQTPLLFRALQRLAVPTLIFVNKVDRAGADPEAVVETMARRLAPSVVAMTTVRDAGRPDVNVRALTADDEAHRETLSETLAEHDDAMLRAYVGDEASLSYPGLRDQLALQTRRGASIPCSSARQGAGPASTSCSPGSASSSRARAATRKPRFQAACSRSSARHRVSASPTRACSRAPCARASGSGSVGARRRKRPRSGSSPRHMPPDAMRSWPERWR